MKPLALLAAGMLLLQAVVCAQVKVTFRLRSLPPYHPSSEAVYLAGSFNRWNPKDPRFIVPATKSGITIELPEGMTEYKLTRGSWETGEAASDGQPATNRQLRVQHDTTIDLDVPHWSDHFPKKPVQSTAGSNVHIIDTAFFIPQLNRYRRIWIYLPASYRQSRRKYPVLYMHDGQNVFDDKTSFSGEWGVDETLDTLGPKVGEAIVVAIDNGGDKRLNEYAPYDMERFGKGEGAAYIDFLVKTLQPYVNKHYRTRKQRRYNFIAGSSMGGLISFYAMLRYPGKFGGAGVFSPAFWVNPQIRQIDPRTARRVKGRIYFFAGQQESESMVPDMLQVFEQMQQHSRAKMQTVIRAEARHNESAWRKEFPLFYRWLMAD